MDPLLRPELALEAVDRPRAAAEVVLGAAARVAVAHGAEVQQAGGARPVAQRLAVERADDVGGARAGAYDEHRLHRPASNRRGVDANRADRTSALEQPAPARPRAAVAVAELVDPHPDRPGDAQC